MDPTDDQSILPHTRALSRGRAESWSRGVAASATARGRAGACGGHGRASCARLWTRRLRHQMGWTVRPGRPTYRSRCSTYSRVDALADAFTLRARAPCVRGLPSVPRAPFHQLSRIRARARVAQLWRRRRAGLLSGAVGGHSIRLPRGLTHCRSVDQKCASLILQRRWWPKHPRQCTRCAPPDQPRAMPCSSWSQRWHAFAANA